MSSKGARGAPSWKIDLLIIAEYIDIFYLNKLGDYILVMCFLRISS